MRSAQVRGAAVKAAREAAGLSQEQLARELAVSVFTVSRWERGVTTRIATVRLLALCQALNVKPDDITEGTAK